MIESLLIFLEQTIIPLGVAGVFLASVIEEVIAPIPSALVMTLSGFLFVSGAVSLSNILTLVFKVAIPAALGVSIGSLVVYGAAFWGGKAILERWGKWLGLYWYDVEKLEARLAASSKDEIAIVLARIIPVVPSVAVSALCGFVRMPVWKYLYITFIGTVVRGFILGAVGWQVGNTYYKFADIISQYEKIGLVLIIFIVIVAVCFLYLRKRRSS